MAVNNWMRAVVAPKSCGLSNSKGNSADGEAFRYSRYAQCFQGMTQKFNVPAGLF